MKTEHWTFTTSYGKEALDFFQEARAIVCKYHFPINAYSTLTGFLN